MANNLTNYGENLALTYLAGQVTQLGLFTTDPGETGVGTEVSGGAYARQSIAFNAGGTSNSADILFPTATANWGTITHFGLFNAGGNMVWYGPLTVSKTVPSGDQFKLGAGKLTLGLE